MQALSDGIFVLRFENGEWFHYSDPVVANAFFPNYLLNLINNERTKFCFDDFDNKLKNSFPLKQSRYFSVWSWTFESNIYSRNQVNEKAYAYELLFKKKSKVKLGKFCEKANYKIVKHIDKKEYDQKFSKVIEHLTNGDCYQLNLTTMVEMQLSYTDIVELIGTIFSQVSKVSQNAHVIHIGKLDELIISNTPETLYETKKQELFTRPIKGSIKIDKNISSAELWRILTEDEKNKAELDIITDLMRNDLTKLEGRPAIVVSRGNPLIVPEILHQFSEIKVNISKDINLYQLYSSLFPGGSITGAPKKRVCKLISQIEKNNRGHYTGSTVFSENKRSMATINIRTLQVNTKTRLGLYGCGGGITLLANNTSEYEEAMLKFRSFTELFTDSQTLSSRKRSNLEL